MSSYYLRSRNEEVLPEMNVARSDFKAILLGEYIYVMGMGVFGNGNEYDDEYMKSCER